MYVIMRSPLTHFPRNEVLNLHLSWKSFRKYSQNVANLIFILVTGHIFMTKTEKYIVRSPKYLIYIIVVSSVFEVMLISESYLIRHQ